MRRRKTKPALLEIGSISHGTMRNEDLIPSFLWELKRLRLSRAERTRVREIEKAAEEEGYYDSDDAEIDVNEDLYDILSAHVPDYCYFGSHPGDGSDYGVWIDEDSLDDDFGRFADDEHLRVDDLSDVPRGFSGMVLLVNDHGNMTLFSARRGRLREIW